jgi:hypothetical protein
MPDESVFTQTASNLQPILDDLLRREPIFHRPQFPTIMSPDYWEVGASGRRYSRTFILETLSQNPPIDAAEPNWQLTDAALTQLGPETYLLTYTLAQNARITRRSTLWRNTPEGWQILYHQGTPVSAPQDDITPPQS